MKVLQAPFSSLLLLLLCLLPLPSTAAYNDDGLQVTEDWADVFSTLTCHCFGWEQLAGSGREQFRSGGYFGISYHNREWNVRYNRTTWEVVRGRLGQYVHPPHRLTLQPKLRQKCATLDDGSQLCYWHHGYHANARYTFHEGSRVLPRGRDIQKYIVPIGEECQPICVELVKLPEVSAATSRRVDYKMMPICPSHALGKCVPTWGSWF